MIDEPWGNKYVEKLIRLSISFRIIKACCCCSIANSGLTLQPHDGSMPGFPELHYLPGFAQLKYQWCANKKTYLFFGPNQMHCTLTWAMSHSYAVAKEKWELKLFLVWCYYFPCSLQSSIVVDGKTNTNPWRVLLLPCTSWAFHTPQLGLMSIRQEYRTLLSNG